MAQRGSYSFEVDAAGRVAVNTDNLHRLRRLFRDGAIIDEAWGPGDPWDPLVPGVPGDFDHGSWHILCHLAAGAGVYSTSKGLAWVAITHDASKDLYAATVSFKDGAEVRTLRLDATPARELLGGAKLLGFVEGASLGHVTARGRPDDDKRWRRADFDQDVSSEADGGTVWEHWCTTRDIHAWSAMGSSVLGAYLELVSLLGGRFVAAVARGRREHDHPTQLAGLVKAGLLTREEATWDVKPVPIPEAAQKLIYEARPADWLAAAPLLPLDATRAPSYCMFQRRIDRWSTAAQVAADLAGIS